MHDIGALSATPTETVLGIGVTILSKEDCVAQAMNWITNGSQAHSIVCANPHSLYVASEDSLFAEALLSADVVVPDGVGVVIASRLFGGQIRKRITGSDIFAGINSAIAWTQCNRVFLLGSTDEVLGRIVARLERLYPGLEVVGVYSPPFKDQFDVADVLDMVERVNRAGPDVLWVGMTAPKQEKWIKEAKAYLDVPVVGAVGAVFDFVAGTKPRPGAISRTLGLEWLGRLRSDPRHLWRRTLVSAPRFLAAVLRERLSNRIPLLKHLSDESGSGQSHG